MTPFNVFFFQDRYMTNMSVILNNFPVTQIFSLLRKYEEKENSTLSFNHPSLPSLYTYLRVAVTGIQTHNQGYVSQKH